MTGLHAGYGNVALDFDSVAAPSYGAMRTHTIKICELCGKNFLKLVISTVRDCEDCTKRQAAIKAERATVPPVDGPNEDFWKTPARAMKIARDALSMRPSA